MQQLVFQASPIKRWQLLSALGLGNRLLPNLASQQTLTASWLQGSLLNLAVDLANRLLPAFDTPTGIPYGSINLKTGRLSPDAEKNMNLAIRKRIFRWRMLRYTQLAAWPSNVRNDCIMIMIVTVIA
jgi:hypothetical protein